jgi:outer membrane protein OmpA-like peptidoglycan-associated protein
MLAAGLSAVGLLFFAQAQSASAQDWIDPTGELIPLSPEQSQGTVILFEDKQVKLTEPSRERLKEYAELVKGSARSLRRVLVIGTTMPTGDFAADQDLAIRRATEVRGELVRLTGLALQLQVSFAV